MRRPLPTAQLGFDDLLATADAANRQQRQAAAIERETGHLPGAMAGALPYHRRLIDAFHAAVLGCNIEAACAAREEAYKLATKLNGGRSGILADDDAPGSVLERDNAAPDGQAPLWGQRGRFLLPAFNAAVAMDGMFGLTTSWYPIPGFSVTAIDRGAPFLSDTGYRSFLGLNTEVPRGCGTEEFVGLVLRAHIVQELKGKLVAVRDIASLKR